MADLIDFKNILSSIYRWIWEYSILSYKYKVQKDRDCLSYDDSRS
jgi:hypothetical protein